MEQIVETYQERLMPAGDIYIFLDEVQEVESWEKWVRSMHELRKAKLVVSGVQCQLFNALLTSPRRT